MTNLNIAQLNELIGSRVYIREETQIEDDSICDVKIMHAKLINIESWIELKYIVELLNEDTMRSYLYITTDLGVSIKYLSGSRLLKIKRVKFYSSSEDAFEGVETL